MLDAFARCAACHGCVVRTNKGVTMQVRMQMQVRVPRRGLAVAVLAVLAVLATAGCAGRPEPGDAQGAGGGGPATTPAATTATTATARTGGGSSTTAAPPGGATTTTGDTAGGESLADGRHAARIVALSAARRTVRVDVVQFLTGEAARKAAAEDGVDDQVTSDHYIRNLNPRLRTLPVAPDVTVVVNNLGFDLPGGVGEDKVISLAKLAGYPDDRVARALFWLTVRQGRVTRIEEQYLP